MTQPKRTTYEIATAEPYPSRQCGRAAVTGYVLGDWGTRKEQYFYEYTHLPTGVKVNTYPVLPETKAAALAHLRVLASGGPAPEVAARLVGVGWGGQ
jgi:hypothetical protein